MPEQAPNGSTTTQHPILTQSAPKAADGPVTLCPSSACVSLGTGVKKTPKMEMPKKEMFKTEMSKTEMGGSWIWSQGCVSSFITLPCYFGPPQSHQHPHPRAAVALLNRPNTPCPGCSSSARTSPRPRAAEAARGRRWHDGRTLQQAPLQPCNPARAITRGLVWNGGKSASPAALTGSNPAPWRWLSPHHRALSTRKGNLHRGSGLVSKAS